MQGNIKSISVTPEWIVHLNTGAFRVVENAVPADARIVGAGFNSPHDRFEIFIEHPSVPLIQEGEDVPAVSLPVIQRLVEPMQAPIAPCQQVIA